MPDSFLQEIISKKKIKKALDIGAGRGLTSLYLAKHGATVDAVDKRGLPNQLKVVPNITCHEIPIEEFSLFPESYDLIILSNVLPFLQKDFVENSLAASIGDALQSGGRLFIKTFLLDDPVFAKSPTALLYTHPELGKIFSPLKEGTSEELWLEESHPPIGPHDHHVLKILYEKK